MGFIFLEIPQYLEQEPGNKSQWTYLQKKFYYPGMLNPTVIPDNLGASEI